MSELHKEIGKRIRVARNIQGITQGDLSQAIGLSRTSMTNIESGFQRVPLEKLYDIAVALNTSIYELLPDKIGEDELKRINEIRDISDQITELQERQKSLKRNGSG